MVDEMIPPAPPVPTKSDSPTARAWYYAGPIVLDSLALVCTTVLVALKVLPVEDFKYLVGILVVGNVALRMPSKAAPPGGGGFLITILAAGAAAAKGLKS